MEHMSVIYAAARLARIIPLLKKQWCRVAGHRWGLFGKQTWLKTGKEYGLFKCARCGRITEDP